MQDIYDGWRDRLRDELADRGWDYKELAKRIGVDPSTAHRIVNGKIEAPSDAFKWRIAAVFGMRMDRMWAWPSVVPEVRPEWSRLDDEAA